MYDTVVRLYVPGEARYKLLRVSAELFLEGTLFNTRLDPDGNVHAIEVEGLPEDARIGALSYDPVRHQVLAHVWSAEFPALKDSETIPEMGLVFRGRVYDVTGAARLLRQAAVWLEPLLDAAHVGEMRAAADRLDGQGVRVPPAEPAPAPDPEPKVKFREFL